MIRDTISAETARRFYDWLGARHDWADFYEGRAKSVARERLDAAPGHRLLNVGAGAGRDHRRLQEAVMPGGMAVALDISPTMLAMARRRTGAPVCEADARTLPFADAGFDRLISTYLLDLLPYGDIPTVLREFRRVLVPDGRIVLVTLTKGIDIPSRLFVAVWEAAYRVNPVLCGGCRPLRLKEVVMAAGFRDVQREVVVQFGVPSEVLTARR